MKVNTLYRIYHDDLDDVLKVEEVRDYELRRTRPAYGGIYDATPRVNAGRRRTTHYESRKERHQ